MSELPGSSTGAQPNSSTAAASSSNSSSSASTSSSSSSLSDHRTDKLSSSLNTRQGNSSSDSISTTNFNSSKTNNNGDGSVATATCGGSNSGRKFSENEKSDETIIKMAPEAVDPAILSRGSLTRRRYTRSALLLLRDEPVCRYRPECAKNPRLWSLGVWKRQDPTGFSNFYHGASSGNNDSAGGVGNNSNSGGGSGGHNGGGGHSSGGGHSGGGGGPRAISTGGALSNGNGINSHKTLIDHRSMSSSHLMPAFAKRRIVGNNNTISTSSSGGGNSGSSNGDPKERMCKDQDSCIILSPQGKGINLGCQMPPVSHNDRDIPTTVRERRIGSGRLLPRDVNWDYRPDKDAAGEGEFSSFRGGTTIYRDHRNSNNSTGNNDRTGGDGRGEYRERYERRMYGRDYDRDNREGSNYSRRYGSDLSNSNKSNDGHGMGGRNSDGDKHMGGHEHRRRQYSESRSEEPEWFSGGPTSQHDTIELRGFDENEDFINYSSSSNYKSSHKSYRDRGGDSGRERNHMKMMGSKNSESNSNHHSKHHQSQPQNQQPQPQNQQPQPQQQNQHQQKQNSPQKSHSDVELVEMKNISPPPVRSTPTKTSSDSNNNSNNSNSSMSNSNCEDDKNKPASGTDEAKSHEDNGKNERSEKHVEFNFEAFLNVDPLNNILVGDSKVREGGSSRFSQWFKRVESQKQNSDSRRSSLHEEINNMLNEQNSPDKRQEDDDHEKYFAPISPAENSQTNTLLELLHRGKSSGNSTQSTAVVSQNAPGIFGVSGENSTSAFPADKQKPGLIPSVEELEARMRKNEIGAVSGGANFSGNLPPATASFNQILTNNLHQQVNRMQVAATVPGSVENSSTQQEMEAFKKLLEQLNNGGVNKVIPNVNVALPVVAAAGLSTNIQHQQQQQQQILLQQMLNRPKQEEYKKLLQQQHQQQQQKQQRNIQQLRPNEIVQKFPQANGRNDILKRPEAQSLLQRLARGDITQNSLLQQLTNASTASRNREVIVSVLSYLNQNSSVESPNLGTQQIVSPTTTNAPNSVPNQSQPQQTTGVPVSPGLSQRIPSPRELQYHTQTIMQGALIKKKLEEQQENFRRRQEIEIQKQQRQQQPQIIQQNLIVAGPGNNEDGTLTFGGISHNSPPPGSSVPQNKQLQTVSQSQINSPTPLAFTPTSVLRKMTAEKDNFLVTNAAATVAAVAAAENVKNLTNKTMQSLMMSSAAHQQQQQQQILQQLSQPRMILGSGSSLHQQQQQQQPQQQQPQQPQVIQTQQGSVGPTQPISPQGVSMHQAMRNNQMKWNSMNSQNSLPKPMGRPILKGGPTPSSATTPTIPPPIMQQPISFTSKLEFQQQMQQRNKNPQQSNILLSQIHLQQQQQQQPIQQQPQNQQNQQLQQQQFFQQRQRAIRAQTQYQQMLQFHQIVQQQQQSGGNITNVPTSGASANARINSTNSSTQQPINDPVPSTGNVPVNFQRDGGLSPTSNQLARWFSPELLAQASAGKLPSLNMGQALSLEEFERSIQHSSATVHN